MMSASRVGLVNIANLLVAIHYRAMTSNGALEIARRAKCASVPGTGLTIIDQLLIDLSLLVLTHYLPRLSVRPRRRAVNDLL